jgi:hypothetical protein
VTVSPFAQLMQQLQQLQTSNPAEFKKVMQDGATQLQAAAAQATDPSQVSALNNLAAKFETASETGSISSLQPRSAGAGTYAPHGHHHHHASSSTDSDSTSSSTGTSTTASSTATPPSVATLLAQLLAGGTSAATTQGNGQSQAMLNSLFGAL